MVVTYCPQCRLPVTSEESQAGACPVCEAILSVSADVPAEGAKTLTPMAPRRGPVFMIGAASILFLAGGIAGFWLHAESPFVSVPDEEKGKRVSLTPKKPEQTKPVPSRPLPASLPPAKSKSPAVPDETSKALKRLKESQTFSDKLSKDLAVQTKRTIEAKDRADLVQFELDKTKKANDDREARLDKLSQDLAAAKAGETAAILDADQARKDSGKVRVKELESINKKLTTDLDAQKRKTQDVKNREEAARRNVDQARREGQQLLEQVRRQNQQIVEQVRREGKTALDQVRRQLRQQELATERARADAEKHRRAAEEARRMKK